MNSRAQFDNGQQGMSLVEMMIAMTISLIVIGAVSGVYLSTSRNYTQDEMLSRMQENARYAMHVLAEDLSMTGYWGPLITDDNINAVARTCSNSDATDPTKPQCHDFYAGSSLTIAADANGNVCAPGTINTATNWAVDITSPIEVASEVASGSDANADFGCIDASEFEQNSDILVVKRVQGNGLDSTRDASADVGDIFLRTNGSDSMLFNYATDLTASEGPSASDWRYIPKVYYIRNYFLEVSDGIPTLVRKTLNGNVMETEDGGVAQGIEFFHIMFGVDNDDDGDTTADYYTSNPAVDNLDSITTARIYVLARSVAPDPNYDNDKTYNLGDISRTFNDNFYRRVFTTTITLRNPRNRLSSSGA